MSILENIFITLLYAGGLSLLFGFGGLIIEAWMWLSPDVADEPLIEDDWAVPGIHDLEEEL